MKNFWEWRGIFFSTGDLANESGGTGTEDDEHVPPHRDFVHCLLTFSQKKDPGWVKNRLVILVTRCGRWVKNFWEWRGIFLHWWFDERKWRHWDRRWWSCASTSWLCSLVCSLPYRTWNFQLLSSPTTSSMILMFALLLGLMSLSANLDLLSFPFPSNLSIPA